LYREKIVITPDVATLVVIDDVVEKLECYKLYCPRLLRLLSNASLVRVEVPLTDDGIPGRVKTGRLGIKTS
jgi:hypothetical protein